MSLYRVSCRRIRWRPSTTCCLLLAFRGNLIIPFLWFRFPVFCLPITISWLIEIQTLAYKESCWARIASHCIVVINKEWGHWQSDCLLHQLWTKMRYSDAMILRLSVTLVDKINNAKSDALLFADGRGIFNRQCSSLMSTTKYLIWLKLNSLEKTPNTIACHESEIGSDNCPWQ